MGACRRLTRLFTGLLLVAAAAYAHAGRPLQTEDAGVLGAGECELESFIARERARGAPTARTVSAQIGCGIGLHTQLALAAARVRVDGEHDDDVALVGKTWLRELRDDHAGVTLAYALGAARAPGGSFRHSSTQVRLVATVPHAGWLLHADVGAARSETDQVDSTTWGLAVERSGVGALDLMAEVFGDDRTDPWVNLGVRWSMLPRRLMLDASFGMQLDAARARLLTVGLKFAF
jgi:hypothetical protein